MKKSKFHGVVNMLTKDQMKQIKGGSGGCGAQCTSDVDCWYPGSNCLKCYYFIGPNYTNICVSY